MQNGPGTSRPLHQAAQADSSGGTAHAYLDEGDSGSRTESGYGSYTMAQMNDPLFYFNRQGKLIGGKVDINIYTIGNGSFKSVSWSVSGAKDHQTYTRPLGETINLGTPLVHNFTNVTNSDNLIFFWDHTTGNHTISTLVTYTDNSTDSLSTTVSVVEPTVNPFVVSVPNAFLWDYNNAKGGQITLYSPGIQYTATVSVPANTEGGTFGFLQLISRNQYITNAISMNHTYSTGGFVLDDWTGAGFPFLIEGQVFDAPAGATSHTPFRGDNPGPPSDDAPQILWYQPNSNDWNTVYGGVVEFQTFLVFRPNFGIWVKISETNVFSMTGDATWDGKQNTFTGNPSVSTNTPTITNVTGFVDWTDYHTRTRAWNPPW